MKNKLTLRNYLLCGAGLLVLVAFVLSFFASVNLSVSSSTMTYSNVIWGTNKVSMTVLGETDAETLKWAPVGVSVAGLVLMVVGCAATVVLPLVVKNAKIAKWASVGAAAVVLVGGILLFTTLNGFAGVLAKENDITIEQAKESLKNFNGKCVIGTVDGVLGVLAGLLLCGAQFVPEKK